MSHRSVVQCGLRTPWRACGTQVRLGRLALWKRSSVVAVDGVGGNGAAAQPPCARIEFSPGATGRRSSRKPPRAQLLGGTNVFCGRMILSVGHAGREEAGHQGRHGGPWWCWRTGAECSPWAARAPPGVTGDTTPFEEDGSVREHQAPLRGAGKGFDQLVYSSLRERTDAVAGQDAVRPEGMT